MNTLEPSPGAPTPDPDQDWYYARDGQVRGPLGRAELRTLLIGGGLPPETLVWAPGMDDWVPATRVVDMAPRLGAQAWRRFWARQLDYILWSTCVGGFLGLGAPDLLERINTLLLGFLTLLAWIPVEAGWLFLFGTTPAKALLGIRVQTRAGANPPFGDGLQRGALLFFYGLGMALPLVQFVALVLAYRRLLQRGETRWDAEMGTLVAFGPLSPLRVGLYVVIILFFLVLAVLGA